jgi:hypothetical protein
MIEVIDGRLKSVTLMIKGGNHGSEKRIVMEDFFDNTWMVSGDRWRDHMRKFIGQYFKERNFFDKLIDPNLSKWKKSSLRRRYASRHP